MRSVSCHIRIQAVVSVLKHRVRAIGIVKYVDQARGSAVNGERISQAAVGSVSKTL